MATVKYNLGTVGGMAVTELFSGSEGNITSYFTGKITLNDDITNYKFLVFDFLIILNGTRFYSSHIVSVQHIINFFNDEKSTGVFFSICWGYSGSSDYFNISKTSTLKSLDYSASNSQCLRIVGIN